MSGADIRSAKRPDPDQVLVDIATYVDGYKIHSDAAYETARYCLMDTLACGFQALDYPACTKLLGPVVPGATLPGGARVPGTSYELDPVQGGLQHRGDEPLAGFQRHLARRRMGPPVGQSRRHSGGGRLSEPPGASAKGERR